MRYQNLKKWFPAIIVSTLIIVLMMGFGCGQKQEEETKVEAEIHWLTDLEEAKILSEEQNKPLMIDFMAEWCPPCQQMEKTTFNQPGVIEKVKSFIPLRIDVDKKGDVANEYNCNASKYGGIGIPNILFIKHDDSRLKHIIGYKDAEALVAVMDSVLTMMD